MKKYFILSIIVLVGLNLPVSHAEPVPSTINYQGYLGDSYGMPLPDGLYDITFSLYNTPSGGAALWTETWQGDDQVSLSSGRFHISLGSVIPFGDMDADFTAKYYLEITVGGYGTLEPRIGLTSVPYAGKAQNIDAMNALAGAVVGTSDVQTLTDKTVADSSITGGTIDQTEIGTSTPAAGTFTGVSAAGNLTIQGSILTRTVIEGTVKTTSYTLLQTDDIILADSSGGNIAITLPPAVGQSGKTYTVFLSAVNAGSTLLLIIPDAGETINGLASLTLDRAKQSVQLVSDGSTWQVRGETGSVMAAHINAVERVNVPVGSSGTYQYVHNSDMVIDGSECIGTDCVNGEAFASDTLRLKENNLRILFVDTSDSASFPGNDWRMTANDSTNGGRGYFSIDDVDGGISGLSMENSGHVNIGFNDAEPRGRLEVHVPDVGTGTVSTLHRTVDRTGTITSGAVTEEAGSGYLFTSGTTVQGNSTAFTTELVTGCQITSAGETKTVVSIESDIQLTVDSAWSSNLGARTFSIPVTPVVGSGTLFSSELMVKGDLIVGGETQVIFSIDSDTDLSTYGSWTSSFTDASFQAPISILTGKGTLFASGDVNPGDNIIISGERKQVTAINSDTDIQVDDFFEADHTDASYDIIKTEFIVSDDGKTGIGTSAPEEAFAVHFQPDTDVVMAQGDSNPNQSVFSLRSPNGTKMFISVDNSGNLSGASVKP